MTHVHGRELCAAIILTKSWCCHWIGQLYNVSEDGYAGELDESAPSTPAMRRLFSPALSHPASDVPASAVTRKQNSKIPGCFFVVESVVWWIVCLGLGIVIPDLTVLFDILGFTMVRVAHTQHAATRVFLLSRSELPALSLTPSASRPSWVVWMWDCVA